MFPRKKKIIKVANIMRVSEWWRIMTFLDYFTSYSLQTKLCALPKHCNSSDCMLMFTTLLWGQYLPACWQFQINFFFFLCFCPTGVLNTPETCSLSRPSNSMRTSAKCVTLDPAHAKKKSIQNLVWFSSSSFQRGSAHYGKQALVLSGPLSSIMIDN